MEETPHVVAHFMAVGAEKRLEDYYFLRNTYETVSAQEIQLNRILRMLGEDEISLNWRIDLPPVGRTRSRSLYDFDRWNHALVLQGSMAYERLRELQQDNSKTERQTTPPGSSRRIRELRDRRQRFSEQRDSVPSSNLTTGGGGAPSSSRLRALAEYDIALAETEAKRQRQTEDNRSNAWKTEETDFATERRREKFKTMFEDENQKYEKSKKQEDEPSKRSTKTARFNDDENESSTRSARNARSNGDEDESSKRLTNNARYNGDEKESSTRSARNTRSNGNEDEASNRLAKNARSNGNEDESSKRSTKNARFNEDEGESSKRLTKDARPDENEDESSKPLTKNARFNENEDELSNRLAKNDRPDDEEDESSNRLAKNDRPDEDEDKSSKPLTKNDRFNENESESSTRLSKDVRPEEKKDESSKPVRKDRFSKNEDDSSKQLTKDAAPDEKKDEPTKPVSKTDRFNKNEEESSKQLTKDAVPEEKKNESSKPVRKDRFSKNEDDSSKQLTKDARPDEKKDEPTKPVGKTDRFNKNEDESNKQLTKDAAPDEKKDVSSKPVRKDRFSKNEDDSSRQLTKDTRLDEKEDESSKPLTKTDRLNKNEDESSNGLEKKDHPDEDADESSEILATDDRPEEDEDEKSTSNQQSDSDKNRKSSVDDDHDKSADIELISFTVRCQAVPSHTKVEDNEESSVRLLCQWASPNSISAINYYTIERQIGDEEWLPIGEKIDKLQTKSQLDISSSDNDDTNENIPSYFRLKAHLRNGQTFTSEPTDEIFINLFKEKKIITPAVEILSPNSVELTWEDEENEDENNEEKPTIYDIEKKEQEQPEWEKVIEVPLSQHSARIDSLTDASQCEFRLIPSSSDAEEITKTEDEPEVLTVHNVNEWLNSLHISPTSPTTVDIDISEEGFQEFDCYKVEYTTNDQLDQWKQMSDITQDDPHLTIDNLKQGSDYKFRFTPVSPGATKSTNEINPSQLSLVLDVKMPSKRRGRFAKDETEAPPAAPPPEFSIQKLDPTTVLIEAVVPTEEPATFKDTFDVFSKNETIDDDDWTKVGTIDKDHLSTTVEDLEENTAYAFKIDNITTSSADEGINTIKEFKVDTTPVKQYDPSLFLEKIEQSLENVVNGVMQAAAGHQTVEEPVNKSLNEVIKEVFRDAPSEQYGFDTLELSTDLQVYRGPKQMMLKELEVTETVDLCKHYGEIIIHNYRTLQHGHKSVVVREENGNTRVGNIDGDIIIRNVVSDVLLSNEETRHKLSMNIVGQAFLKGVQGTLIASKFKGIIVVKNVNKP